MKHLMTTILAILLMLPVVLLDSSNVAAQQVEVAVKVIYASKNGNEVNENVKDVYERLKKMFDFTSYNKLVDYDKKAGYKSEHEIDLPNGQKLILTATGKDKEDRIKVDLEITGVVKTDFRLKDGGTIILGGTRHQDGVLVLVIKVSES